MRYKKLIQKIQQANSIALTTHRSPDGDGLGAEVALAHALKEMGKKVELLHVDLPDIKYNFLTQGFDLKVFDKNSPTIHADLVIITDTNDGRMLPGLFSEIQKQSIPYCFIDHHPKLEEAPPLGELSVIDTTAASTGEMAFYLIQDLVIPMSEGIAQALYTSVCFDTQLFRYIRSSASSHALAAKIVPYIFDTEYVHEQLFGNISINKFRFMANYVTKIEFYYGNSVAVLVLRQKDLEEYELKDEDTRDIIDNILSIDTVQIAALIFQQADGLNKMSFRSRRKIPILPIAEKLGGGGHTHAAGAYSELSLDELKVFVLNEIRALL